MPDWIPPAIAIAWSLCCIALACRWFFFERKSRRDTPRCPKCWHDMSGLDGSRTCPECGHTAKSEKRLHRKRRKIKLACICLVLTLAPLWLLPSYERRAEGWTALLPTSALIIASEWLPDLEQRWNPQGLLYIRSPDFTDWQARLYTAWRTPIGSSFAEHQVCVRETWFRGEPIPISVRDKPYVSPAHAFRSIEVRVEGSKVFVENFYPESWVSGWPSYRMPRDEGFLPAGEGESHTVRLNVSAEASWHQYRANQDPLIIERSREHVIERTVRLIDRDAPDAIEQILQLVNDSELDAYVKRSVNIELGPNAYGNNILYIRGAYEDQRRGLDQTVGYLYDIKIIDEAGNILLVETEGDHLVFNAPTEWHHADDDSFIDQVLHPASGVVDIEGLRLVVEPRHDLALYAPELVRVWDGRIERPLREAFSVSGPGMTIKPADE